MFQLNGNYQTVEEMLHETKLDWEVKTQPIYTMSQGKTLSYPKVIEGQYATVRATDQKPLGIVGNRYEPIQNMEALHRLGIDTLMASGVAKGIGGGFWGDRVVSIISLGNGLEVAGDQIDRHLIVVNNHTGEFGMSVFISPFRPRCSNQLAMAMAKALWRLLVKHTSSWIDRVEAGATLIKESNHTFTEWAGEANLLASKILSPVEVANLMDNSFGITQRVKALPEGQKVPEFNRIRQEQAEVMSLLDTPEVRPSKEEYLGSAWHYFNAISRYTDHNRVYKGATTDPTKAYHGIMFGAGQEIKNKAWDTMLEMV